MLAASLDKRERVIIDIATAPRSPFLGDPESALFAAGPAFDLAQYSSLPE